MKDEEEGEKREEQHTSIKIKRVQWCVCVFKSEEYQQGAHTHNFVSRQKKGPEKIIVLYGSRLLFDSWLDSWLQARGPFVSKASLQYMNTRSSQSFKVRANSSPKTEAQTRTLCYQILIRHLRIIIAFDYEGRNMRRKSAVAARNPDVLLNTTRVSLK